MSQKHQMKLKCVVRRVILIALAKLASSICTLKVTVTREVVIQPIGGLVPHNFNANIDASFIWNVNFSNFSWKSIPNSDQFGGKVRILDHFRKIGPKSQHWKSLIFICIWMLNLQWTTKTSKKLFSNRLMIFHQIKLWYKRKNY